MCRPPDPDMEKAASAKGSPKFQSSSLPHQNTEVASALQEKKLLPGRIRGWRSEDCYLPASRQNLPRKPAESEKRAGIVVNELTGGTAEG
jgi:hypothetical protein